MLSLPCCDLPVGRFVDRGVQPPLQKYFASVVGRNIFMSLAIPSHTEGRFAIVTDVGTGCGGRGSVLHATGSQGGSMRPVSDTKRADERCCCVRRSRVVLTPRRWRQVRGVKSAQPGLDKTYPRTTVTKKPGHRGELEISRKTIACGNAGRFRCTRCEYSCAFLQPLCAHEAAGALGARHSPRPPRGRKINANLGRIAPRDRERASEIVLAV